MSKKNRYKHRYVQAFGITVIMLALVRCAFPGIARNDSVMSEERDTLSSDMTVLTSDARPEPASVYPVVVTAHKKPHAIGWIGPYPVAFPDSNHVQLEAAHQWGVKPVKNRIDAEQRKDEVVYMGTSPYYDVAHLDASIPYLVPRAAILLEDIGRLFYDSLQAKGMPLHRIVVSSVLRTQDDIARLRRTNKNATENSCHLYATTFDINYTRFNPVMGGDMADEHRLKRVLAEVLRDLRFQGRCYVKYEQVQPCFHITVR